MSEQQVEDKENKALTIREGVQFGAMELATPHDVLDRASVIAKELAGLIEKQKLFSVIQGKKYVRVEGWTTMGAMLGVTPREVSATELEDGSYEAVVELVRVSDQAIIGRASAFCGRGEIDKNGKETWMTRAPYARRSMAVTRATSKAFRLAFSWIMALSGYEVTPAEEMIVDGEYRDANQPQDTTRQRQERATATQTQKASKDTGATAQAPVTSRQNEKATRPLPPEKLKEFIERRATGNRETRKRSATDKQRALLVGQLSTVFDGDVPTRHSFCKWLTGTESTKEIDGSFVNAILDWLEIAETDSGLMPSTFAIQEGHAAATMLLKAEGQTELPIDRAEEIKKELGYD